MKEARTKMVLYSALVTMHPKFQHPGLLGTAGGIAGIHINTNLTIHHRECDIARKRSIFLIFDIFGSFKST